MTDDARDDASERLLDAALEQVLGAHGQAAHERPRQRWLAAALVLLAVSVVVVLWSQSRVGRGGSLAPAGTTASLPQEPAPLPPPRVAQGRAAIEALPADTANLIAEVETPDDLVAFAHLNAMRHLSITCQILVAVPPPPGPSPKWADPPADVLAPLATLPALEDLMLPSVMHVLPEHLRPLRTLPRLRALALTGDHVVCTQGLVDELAALPRLRELRLGSVSLTADFADRMASLPLERLRLYRCPGIDAKVLGALASMRSLRALELIGFGAPSIVNGRPQPALPRLEPASLARLAELPQLVELNLGRCELDEALLAALPARLQRLDLADATGITAAAIGSLRRLGELRELVLGAAGDEQIAAVAALLPLLRLRTLEWHGALTKQLLDAIANQPALERLRLHVPGLTYARAPQLAHLPAADPRERESWDGAPTANAHFAVLRRCPRLQRVVLTDFDAADAVWIKVALGDRIAVETGNGIAIELPKSGPEPAASVPKDSQMVWARTPAELAALPATTERLSVQTLGRCDLSSLARFAALRELLVLDGDVMGPAHPMGWQQAKDDALAPLERLPALERLELPMLPKLRPTQIAPLRSLPRLRALLLDGTDCTPEIADALVALPHLQELTLRNATVAVGFLTCLRPLGLRRLSLQSPMHFGADRQAEIVELRSLQALDVLVPVKANAQWLPFDRDALGAIGRLPELRELSFSTGQDDEEELLDVLPLQLTKLHWTRPVTAATAARLRRFAGLRELVMTTSDEAAADATAELVGALRLRSFANGGVSTPALLRALAAQPDLDTVDMKLRQGTDLALLAKAPKLRDLTLSGYGAFKLPTDYTPTLADVQPLAGCAALRKLRLINCGLGSAEVQAAVGKQVSVDVEELL